MEKKINYKGYKIDILQDNDPLSPREWDCFGTIYSNSRSYNPDNHGIEEIFENEEYLDENEDFSIKKFEEKNIFLKIYAYIHSGISLSISRTGQYACPFDSGLFGIIAVSKEKAQKYLGEEYSEEKVLEYLRGEIELLNNYYNGEAYGFIVTSPEGEEFDSCWGYYGDSGIEDIISECKENIDKYVQWSEKLNEIWETFSWS